MTKWFALLFSYNKEKTFIRKCGLFTCAVHALTLYHTKPPSPPRYTNQKIPSPRAPLLPQALTDTKDQHRTRIQLEAFRYRSKQDRNRMHAVRKKRKGYAMAYISIVRFLKLVTLVNGALMNYSPARNAPIV